MRPDRVVGWRSAGAAEDAARTLSEALGKILGRALRARAGGAARVDKEVATA